VGLDRAQREIVANVARYHRKRSPTTKHWHFEHLALADRERVRKMAALLRAADVLDREHRQLVRTLVVRRADDAIHLDVAAEGEILLERWAAEKKFGLFEEVFGVRLAMD
jgi:exopolyphosphatase/guanosine-5'-triphosphate,3'-diphosphate pyrophosphatase